MENNHSTQDTIRYMYGNWAAESKEGDITKEYSLKISNEEVHLTIKENGKEVTNAKFENSAHWLEQYLFFWNTTKYFLTYADESFLSFGELTNPTVFDGKNKFFLKFSRVR